jgi:hypothetical protein
MRLPLLASVLLVAALSACSSIKVTNDYDDTVNFSVLKTWSWYPEPGGPGAGQSGIVTLTTSRIKSALEGELIGRRYEYVAEKGDFLVTFHTVLQQKIESTGDPYGYAWRRGYMGVAAAPDVMTYDEGSLLVDFIDPKTKTMIWRGTATAVVDPSSSTEKKEGLVREAVAEIMAQFPPHKKK